MPNTFTRTIFAIADFSDLDEIRGYSAFLVAPSFVFRSIIEFYLLQSGVSMASQVGKKLSLPVPWLLGLQER